MKGLLKEECKSLSCEYIHLMSASPLSDLPAIFFLDEGEGGGESEDETRLRQSRFICLSACPHEPVAMVSV